MTITFLNGVKLTLQLLFMKVGLAAFTLLTLPSVCFSQLISTRNDSLIREGIRLSIEQSYPKAISIFSKMQVEMPGNPTGYFFHSAVLQTQMMDYEIYDKEAEFLALVKKTIQLSQNHIRYTNKDPWAYFFLGGGYGYLAFYQGKQNKLMEAFKTSRNSMKALEKTLKNDSTLYDLYFGLGTYKYYRSKLSRYFTWLPFVGDERKQGIEMIKTAMQKSKYSRYSAMSGLCWIYIEEENYKEGFEIVKKALEEFPQSRIFLWCAAKTAKKLELWDEAAGYYEKILLSLKTENVLSPYNEIICRVNLYEIYAKLEKFQETEEQCQKILVVNLNKADQKRLSKNFKTTQKSCRDFSRETALRHRVYIKEVPN